MERSEHGISIKTRCYALNLILFKWGFIKVDVRFVPSFQLTMIVNPMCNHKFLLLCKDFKRESIRKLHNFNSQCTKTLYQNNLKNIAFFFYIFEGLKM